VATRSKTPAAKDHEGDGRLMVHTTFRLPRALHERLTKASGDRGIGEEIRRRLEVSFDKEGGSLQTRQLMDAIAQIAADTTEYFGAWHADAFAFQAFIAAVGMLLTHYQPKGDPAKKMNPNSLADVMFRENDTAQDIGQDIARLVLYGLQKSKTEQR
jgi:hypothetical protein